MNWQYEADIRGASCAAKRMSKAMILTQKRAFGWLIVSKASMTTARLAEIE